MVILDYSRCEGCRKLKSTKAITLNKILPEVLVDNIVSFDCCYYCGMKRAREVENKHNEHLSKIEKQIQYFQKNKMSVFNEGSIAKEMLQLKILIDKGDSPFSKVLKSYVRNCYRMITRDFCLIISNIYNKDWLKEYIGTCTNIPSMKYTYYKRTYPDKWLCKLLVYEYLNDLISYDKNYIDNDELKDYLNEVFDDYTN